MRAWAGIVLAVLAGGVLCFVTEADDVASELTSSRQSVYEIRPGDGIGPVEIGMSRMGLPRDGQSQGLEPEFAALYDGVDVFRTPAKRLVGSCPAAPGPSRW